MFLNKKLLSLTLACAVWLTGALPVLADNEPAAQDEIVLKNGSRILGTVTGARDGVVTIDTEFAGTLNVAIDKIKAVHTDDPAVILLTDDTVLRGGPFIMEDERLVVSGDAPADSAYPLSVLGVVNPEPWELGEGYKWSGLVNAALVLARGNTDSDEFDYKVESVWRSTQDRITLMLGGEKDEVNGVKNADNWKLSGKYDYFLAEPYYVGALVSAERDKFTDLDMRYIIGPYIGRQFYDTPHFSLSGELGLSYVSDEFFVAEDDDYAASNWALHASSNYLGGDSRLYMDQTGIWNLDDTSNVIVDTVFGLAFPLMWNLEGAAEMLLEYDSSVIDEVDEVDTTYRFRVGYTW